MTTDPRIDAYIARSAAFAHPVLSHLRQAVHAACPETEETIKWGMPFFVYGGRPLAHMAAFKQHCAFGFWNGQLLAGEDKADEAMGQFGRITGLESLPGKRELKALIQKAAALIDNGVKPPRARKTGLAKPPPVPPADLAEAFTRLPAAKRGFDALPPSGRREYIEWLETAKRAETRERRLKDTLAWLAEGKARNWKHQGC